MNFNIKYAFEAIKQPSWWLWCILFLPIAYNYFQAANQSASLKSVVLMFICFFVQILFGGFIIRYMKAFSKDLIDEKIKIDTRKSLEIGFKYFLYNLVIVMVFFCIFTLAMTFFILIGYFVAKLGSIAIIIYSLLASVPIIMLFAKLFYMFMTAILIFIENGKLSFNFSYSSLNNFVNKEWKKIFKYATISVLWAFIFIIISMFFTAGLTTLCKPLAVVLQALISYINAMFMANLTAQLLHNLRPALHENFEFEDNQQPI